MGFRKTFLEHITFWLLICFIIIMIAAETVLALPLVIPAAIIGLVTNKWPSEIFWAITRKIFPWFLDYNFVPRLMHVYFDDPEI